MRFKHKPKSLLGRIAVIALTGTALVSFAAAAQAADLYVSPNGSDSNSGTQTAPFRTILAASQAAQPGTTVHVAAGTYAGGFTTAASGTASAHIVYVSDTQYGAKIVGGGAPANGLGAWWNQGNYVDIKGFEIDGSGSQATAWRFGFYGSGSYTTFQSGKVHDLLSDPTAFSNAAANGSGGAAIEMDNYSGAVNGSIIGNIVYNIGPSGVSSSLVHGIYQIESGQAANNVVYNVVGNGVVTWHGARDIQIVNNTIDNARDGGIVVGSGDSGSSSTTGNYITAANNIVTNSVRGIYEYGITGPNNVYVNNLLYNNTQFNVQLQNGLVATGTVSADPKFVNAAGGDYHLQSGSPAIGAGSAAYAPSTDLAGTPRSTKAPSIGAYEPTPAGTPSPSTDLYVSTTGSDSNSGSQSAPFLTILAASQVAKPGMTVHVAPGTYAGGFTTTASGTSSAHITYVSDTPYGAKIVGGGAPANGLGAWWNRGDYVDVKGFEIDGSGSQATGWRLGFYGTGSYSTFQSNKVHDILTDSTAFANAQASGNGGAGAEMDNYYGGVNGSMISNIVYNIGPSGQTSGLVHGIYQIESGTVADNVVYNVVGTGLVTWHGARNIQIANNTVANARNGGIVVGSGDSGSSSTTGDYITVANNIVTNSRWGIYEYGITGVHNRYVDNLMYNNTQFAIRLQNGLTATGTINANPKFVNAAARNYHLQSGSPAIGAGAAAYAPSTDLDGKQRSTTAPSIGAYEGSSATALNGTRSTSTGTSSVVQLKLKARAIPQAQLAAVVDK